MKLPAMVVEFEMMVLLLLMLLLVLLVLRDVESGLDTFLEGTAISFVPSLLRMWVALLLAGDNRGCRWRVSAVVVDGVLRMGLPVGMVGRERSLGVAGYVAGEGGGGEGGKG